MRVLVDNTKIKRFVPGWEATVPLAEGVARSVAWMEADPAQPSATMIAQRSPAAAPAVQGSAERLPAADRSFDAALAVLTVHHWSDRRAAFDEIRRVARDRAVFLTWFPGAPFFGYRIVCADLANARS